MTWNSIKDFELPNDLKLENPGWIYKGFFRENNIGDIVVLVLEITKEKKYDLIKLIGGSNNLSREYRWISIESILFNIPNKELADTILNLKKDEWK